MNAPESATHYSTRTRERPSAEAILAAVSRRISRCVGSSAGAMNRSMTQAATPDDLLRA